MCLPKATLFEMFLLNTLKHHLPSILSFIANTKSGDYIKEMSVIGNSLMDLYIGELDILGITNEIGKALQEEDIYERQDYITWILEKGYQKRSISDGSEWILLVGDDPLKYVHLHPARYSPHSLRIKATALKTAISFLMEMPGEEPDTNTLNLVRKQIGLSPIKDLSESQHLLNLIALIKERMNRCAF